MSLQRCIGIFVPMTFISLTNMHLGNGGLAVHRHVQLSLHVRRLEKTKLRSLLETGTKCTGAHI